MTDVMDSRHKSLHLHSYPYLYRS